MVGGLIIFFFSLPYLTPMTLERSLALNVSFVREAIYKKKRLLVFFQYSASVACTFLVVVVWQPRTTLNDVEE